MWNNSCERLCLSKQLDYYCDPCNFLKHEGNKCCKKGKEGFRHNPEFQVRHLPIFPYPQKLTRPTAVKSRYCYNERTTLDKSENICKISGEFDSRFCLQAIHRILEGTEIQWEEMGGDVLTIWSIYLRASPTGLFLSDADLMSHILMQVALNYDRLSYAKEFLELIHTQLTLGLRIKKTADLTDFKRMAYALTIMGEAVCAGDASAQAKILDIITVWLDKAVGKKNCTRRVKGCSRVCGDVRQVTRPLLATVFIQSLELSKLPRLLGDFVKDGAYTMAYCNFLHVLRLCCDCSAIIRGRMMHTPLLDPLLLKLCLDDPSNRILSRTVDLVYSLFGRSMNEGAKVTDIDIPCPHEGTFQILLTRLFLQLNEFSSTQQLHLRNDTAFLICLMTTKIPALKKSFGRYSHAVGAIVSSNIFGVNDHLQVRYLVDSTFQDVEFLTFLIWMLDLVISSGSSLHIIEEYQLVPALIAVLMGPSKLIDAMAKAAPIEVLESVAWFTLITIAKMSPTSFLVNEGVPAMMDYLKVYNQPGSCSDHRLVSMFTHLLRTLLSHTSDSTTSQIIHFFHERGTMIIFVDTIVRLTRSCTETEEPVLPNVLFCCAALGSFGMQEKEDFLDSNGVHVFTQFLGELICQPENERYMDTILHVAIAECALKCVADSPSCLEIFLAQEGLLQILDLLAIGAGPSSNLHIFNCILELCEYPRCIDQLLTWTRRGNDINQDSLETAKSASNNNCNLSALFCRLWRDEEKRFGVLRTADGCISSIDSPLLSEFATCYQRPEGHSLRLQTPTPGPASLDLVGSIRPKIFLLIRKITEAISTETQLIEGLGLQDQLTMEIIINFLDLKCGEIWLEIGKSVNDEQFNLVPSDANAMNLLGSIARNKTFAVLEKQQSVLQQAKDIEEAQERKYFEEIQKWYLQDLKETECMKSQTTKYNKYEVERRLWQKRELEKAKALVQELLVSEVHGTKDELHTTIWPSHATIPDSELSRLLNFDEEMEGDRELNELNQPPPLLDELDFDKSVASPDTYLTTFLSDNAGHHDHTLQISMATMMDGDADVTPPSVEKGFYMVSPEDLRKALTILLAKEKKKNWMEKVIDENYWRVRTKWKQDWYPEEH